MNDPKLALQQAVVRLYESERFYAEIVLQMNRMISKAVPTAGVRIKDRVELFVNPDFFASLSTLEQVAVLKHECQHILHDHIPRSKELAPEVYAEGAKRDGIDGLINNMKHRSINIAADCAINPGISNLPKERCEPQMFDLSPGETLEWYHANLKDNEKAKDFMEVDGHELWSESEGDKEELRQKIKNAVNAAAQKTRAAGKMTSENELMVSRLNKSSKNWKQELQRFAARQLETFLESSRKKRNRRYGVVYPGSVKIERLNIGVAIDTSGSVSDEALTQFMSEIDRIAKYAVVTVVEADTEVKNHYVYDPKKKYSVKGRGGTAYQPAFDWFNKQKDKVDGVIYFGDMDAYDVESIIKPKYPVLWAIVGSQKPPVLWGSKINIEVRD